MMVIRKISVINAKRLETAVLAYNEHPPLIHISLEGGFKKEYQASDVYECLGKIITDPPEISFLCKGAKLNVRPSSMLSQMTSGIIAYEHKMGTQMTRNDTVNIFDYDDQNILHDPAFQKAFFFEWLESLKSHTKKTQH
ncbi:hypothetical protein ACYZT9_18615 [Pseudomonas sp. ZT5P21]